MNTHEGGHGVAHVTDEEVERFLSGRLAQEDFQRVLRHLMSRCVPCRVRLGLYAPALFEKDLPPVDTPPEVDAAYDEVLDRVFGKALAAFPDWERERRQVGEVVETVRREGMGVIAKLDEDLHPGALVEALLQLIPEARHDRREDMVELASLALLGAGNLDPERYGPRLSADLRIRAWAELANAYRVNEDFDAAERSFAEAFALFDQKSGDPLVMARVLDLLASLRSAQGRLPEAIDLLNTVYDLYEESGERHLAGRALIARGICTCRDGNPREAVGLLREGISMLDSGRDPQLVVQARESLAQALLGCGNVQEARRLLLESGHRLQPAP